jgi:hypothetical protein
MRPYARTALLAELEESMGDCLAFAKRLDGAGLAEVIQLLRRARNQLVWKMGP